MDRDSVFFFLFVFLFFLFPAVGEGNWRFLGVIVAIRSAGTFQLEVEQGIDKKQLEDLVRSKTKLVLIKDNEVWSCFTGSSFHAHKDRMYMMLQKIPCKESKPLPAREYFSASVFVYEQTDTIEAIQESKEQTVRSERKETKKEIIHPVDKKVMVYVPEDYLLFGQGSNPDDPSYNPYYYDYNQEVLPRIQAFYIDKYEVTNYEFLMFCKKSYYPCPDVLKDLKREDRNKPFLFASYEDVEAYAKWAGKQIPTEWEWELAARGGISKRNGDIFGIIQEYPSSPETCNVLDNWKGRVPQVLDVYSLRDINFRGIAGLCGNAPEWTSSFFLPYPGNRFRREADSLLAGKYFRVLRGGSYNMPVDKAKVYSRIAGGSPDFSGDAFGGFRLILRSK